MDITEIPLNELLQDLQRCQSDILVCELYLSMKETYADAFDWSCTTTEEVVERLQANKEIIAKIKAELKRRSSTEEGLAEIQLYACEEHKLLDDDMAGIATEEHILETQEERAKND